MTENTWRWMELKKEARDWQPFCVRHDFEHIWHARRSTSYSYFPTRRKAVVACRQINASKCYIRRGNQPTSIYRPLHKRACCVRRIIKTADVARISKKLVIHGRKWERARRTCSRVIAPAQKQRTEDRRFADMLKNLEKARQDRMLKGA